MWKSSRRRVLFPPVSWASRDGVIAVGGRPDAETLKEAYGRGIFPWPHDGVPLLWFCPDPRFVLEPPAAHVSRSLRKEMRRGAFEVRTDTAFREVISRCSQVPRPEQRGTWITPEMIDGYTALHGEGLAHSIEAWQEGRLVGGLYGISLGSIFFGESMFADVPNASKVAFATLLANLILWRFPLIDCQSHTPYLEGFGAVEWPRRRFLSVLRRALKEPTRPGPWTLELSAAEAAEALAAQDRSARLP
jgi:leucyl/phenylalanyl-tRNA--protein transferase